MGGDDVTRGYVEELRRDVRDEIKRRIEQRDRYSIQLAVALGAIVAIAFARPGIRGAMIAAPLVSIYFTVLILYSYRIHEVLAGYLKDYVEPEMQRLAGTQIPGWETYYALRQVSGIRWWFFVVALWVVTGASLPIVYPTAVRQGFVAAFWVLAVLYAAADAGITITFARGRTRRSRSKTDSQAQRP